MTTVRTLGGGVRDGFPAELGDGLRNGQAARARPVEVAERATAILIARRKLSIPGPLMPVAIGAPRTASWFARVLREPYTDRCTLRLFWYTQWPDDAVTARLITPVDNSGIKILPPSQEPHVDYALETEISAALGGLESSDAGQVELQVTVSVSNHGNRATSARVWAWWLIDIHPVDAVEVV